MKYKVKYKINDASGFSLLPEYIRKWTKENGWELHYSETINGGLHATYIKYVIPKHGNSELYVKLGIKLPSNEQYSPVIYKMNNYSEYLLFSDKELKFFDSYDYELSEMHKLKSGQEVTDWLDGVKE